MTTSNFLVTTIFVVVVIIVATKEPKRVCMTKLAYIHLQHILSSDKKLAPGI